MNSRLILIRHAERPEIPAGQIGNHLSLTEHGVLATKQFARKLMEPIVSIQSSPVLRCMQTAQLIANTNGYAESEIKESRLLGDPGFFIEDGDIAWQSWLDKGSDAVNSHLLYGTETWPGFYPFDLAVANLSSHIRNALSLHRSGIIVWVTHDTILATLASRVLSSPLTQEDWPNYLGYLDVSVDDNKQMYFSYSN